LQRRYNDVSELLRLGSAVHSSPPRHRIADQLRSGAHPQEFNVRSARGHVPGGRFATSTLSSAEISPQFPSKSWINMNRLLPGPCRPAPIRLVSIAWRNRRPSRGYCSNPASRAEVVKTVFRHLKHRKVRTLSIDRSGTGIGCRAAGSTCQASPHRNARATRGYGKSTQTMQTCAEMFAICHCPRTSFGISHVRRGIRCL
jgi:hypothetical protein